MSIRTTVLAALAIWLLMPLAGIANRVPSQDGTTQALFVSNDGTFQRYRIPSLIVTKKGTLLAICEGRVDGGGLTGNIDLAPSPPQRPLGGCR